MPQPTLSFPRDWKKPRTATGCPGNSSGFQAEGKRHSSPAHPPFVVPHYLFTTASFLSGTHLLVALDS